MQRVWIVYLIGGGPCTPPGAPRSWGPAAPLRSRARLILMTLGTTLGLLGVATIASAQIPLALPSPVASATPDTAAGMGTARTQNTSNISGISGRPASAAAPARPGVKRWTIEFRGGLGLSTRPTGGTGQLPALGNLILSPEFAFGQARTVSSWLFGDGASQLNSIAASLPNVPLLPALDPVLTSLSATRRAGGSVGFTISRDISRHVRADINVDASFQPLALTSAATSAIDATRAGFITTWQGVLGSSPISGLVVNATRTGAASAGRQVRVSGTLTYRFKPQSSFDPFLTYGVGVLSAPGGTPSAVLTGNVQFTIIGPYTETDAVTIHGSDGGSRYVGVIGGGIDKDLSAHSGLRFTALLAIGANRAETTIDASPTNQLSWVTNELLISSSTTTIVINNGPPTPGLFGLQSTLSAKPIVSFLTFIGSGVRIDSTVTVGYFIRF